MNRYDSGEGLLLMWLIISVSAVAGMVIGGLISYNQGNRGKDLFVDIVKGLSAGLLIGGAIVMLSATFVGAAYVFGHASATTVFCGVPIAQAFATGALAYNFVALFIAPFLGIEIEPIELDTATQPSLPNPYDRMERT